MAPIKTTTMSRRKLDEVRGGERTTNCAWVAASSQPARRKPKTTRVYCLLLLVIGAPLCLLILQLAAGSSGRQLQVHCQELQHPGRRSLAESGSASSVSALLLASSHSETKGPVDLLDRNRRMAPALLLAPINELRVSGSKSEPPSRPSQDWSRQKPHFGQDMQREVSVELGKTAYLTCKVHELGDKTVSWLRPRENEILTAGRYTYINDDRFTPHNDHGSQDWVLEIKDVGVNDSTSYECQVSTDPKMSTIINLHVKAAKAKIKQGEQYHAFVGNNIEFACEISLKPGAVAAAAASPSLVGAQTYWYHEGNLLNYATSRSQPGERNFSIDWDPVGQVSRFKLFNVRASDAGNYSCKPTSAEPATIRLHVKRANFRGAGTKAERGHHQQSNSYHSANTKEAQRTRGQHYGLGVPDDLAGELAVGSSAGRRSLPPQLLPSAINDAALNRRQLAVLLSCLLLQLATLLLFM